MISPSVEPRVNQNLAIEPIRGLKCPVSLESMTNPVYLKGCEHIFEKDVIKDIFNESFKDKNTAICPMCNRVYSLAKMLSSFETRVEAINSFFSKILIVPVVSNEINGLLEKRKNKIAWLSAQNEQLNKHFEQFSQQVAQLEGKITILQRDLGKTNALLHIAIEEKRDIENERNEALQKLINTSAEKNEAIRDRDDAIKKMNSVYMHLKVAYSASTVAMITLVAALMVNTKK